MREVIAPNDALEKMRTEYTETEKVILQRRSVRKYRKEQVPDWMVHRILEAGRFAPSSGNGQPWKFVVLRDSKIINEIHHDLTEITTKYSKMLDYRKDHSWWKKILAHLMIRRQPQMLHPTPFGAVALFNNGKIALYHNAPTVVMIFKDTRGISCPDLDAGIVGQNMALAAHSMGLGTCWVSFTKLVFEHSHKWKKFFGIEYPYEYASSLSIGFPAGEVDGMVPRPVRPVDWFEDGKKETFFAEGVRRKIPAGQEKKIPDYGDKSLFPPGKVAVDADKCTGCTICTKICPVGALVMDGNKAMMLPPAEHECFLCGACYSICPPKAIKTISGPGFSGRFTDIDRGPLTLPMLDSVKDYNSMQ